MTDTPFHYMEVPVQSIAYCCGQKFMLSKTVMEADRFAVQLTMYTQQPFYGLCPGLPG